MDEQAAKPEEKVGTACADFDHIKESAEPRSMMAELLSPEEIRHLEVAEGRWFLPGPPP